MKKMIKMIAKWPIWKLSGGKAFLIMIGCWIGLAWILGPISDIAYGLSILVAFFGPTALFCFLFARHWLLRANYPQRDGLGRWIGCILACGVTTLLAIQTALSYARMNDAPRGLVWDVNVVVAPLLGAGALLLARIAVSPSSVFRGRREHNQALHAPSVPTRGAAPVEPSG